MFAGYDNTTFIVADPLSIYKQGQVTYTGQSVRAGVARINAFPGLAIDASAPASVGMKQLVDQQPVGVPNPCAALNAVKARGAARALRPRVALACLYCGHEGMHHSSYVRGPRSKPEYRGFASCRLCRLTRKR